MKSQVFLCLITTGKSEIKEKGGAKIIKSGMKEEYE